MSFSKLGLAASALVLACFIITARGQGRNVPPTPQTPIRTTPSIFDPSSIAPEKVISEMSAPRAARPGAFPASPRRALTEEHKRRLFPSAEERERFAAFLRQPNTGLARLLPQSDCRNDPRVLDVGNKCLEAVPPVPGGGSFYSFGSGDHQAARLADVWLRDGIFRAGVAGDALGLITALGDVPLETVTPQSAAAAYLAQFSPPATVADAERQYKQAGAGFRARGQDYGIAAQVRPDTTYLLRSIIYGAGGGSFAQGRKATDVLVSFRVVSRAEDGSVTLLWRELIRSKPPKLKN